ncbi:MAG: transposase [Gammaproteobacteria bacterium]|nr:transposase [Gammaproteobacteria bacterium]
MSKKKTKFTKEFKSQAVKLATTEGYTQAEAAKNLGIDARNLSRWIQESRPEKQIGKSTLRFSTSDQEELQQLRKEVKRLKMERDILKKATAFFVNENA